MAAMRRLNPQKLWNTPFVRRMRRDGTKGSAIVEFAMVAPVFFMFMFGIIEMGMIYYGNSVLEKATEDAARMVRTGQVQAAAMTQTEFRDYICERIEVVLKCDSNLYVDLQSFTQFGGNGPSDPLDADGKLNTDLNHYQVGGPGDVVLLRTFYTWNLLTPLVAPFIQNMANGERLLTATAAFRNEPFN